MEDLDKKRFEEIVLGTAEIFSTVKKVDVTKPMLRIYFATLKQYTVEQVSKGFEDHLCDPVDGKFFPKPANIIRQINKGQPNTEDKALLAWAQVIREVRLKGSYGTLKLDDRQAMAAVKSLGSWKQLCQTEEADLTWKKKEFIANYSMYEHTPIDMLPSSMPGLVDLQNHKTEENEVMTRLKDGVNSHRAKLE